LCVVREQAASRTRHRFGHVAEPGADPRGVAAARNL
jgi:hypothetical protein